MNTASKWARDIEALFRLSQAEFVGARNALAARMRKEEDVAAANEVKSLVKPSLSAWVVNQLYWAHRDDFDRLLAAGTRLRADQQRGLQGGRSSGLQVATADRREALTGLLRRSELLLAGAGRTAGPGMMKRIETTLEAVAALGGAGDGAKLGCLVRDLEPPGFDALLTLAAAAPLVAPPERGPERDHRPVPEPEPEPEAEEGPSRVRPLRKRAKVSNSERSTPAGHIPRSSDPAENGGPMALSAVADAVARLEHARQAAGTAEAARAAAAKSARLAVAAVSEAKRRLALSEKCASEADVELKRAAARKGLADEEVARAEDGLVAARAAAEKARRAPES